MGVQKKTRKFAQMKRMIGQRDARLKENQKRAEQIQKAADAGKDVMREAPPEPSQLFFSYNTALRAPFPILIDSNFFSHTVRAKLGLLESLMDCLQATVRPMVTSCVLAEMERLGTKYRLAMQIARDERWERLSCDHTGVYADDCIVDRCVKSRIYIVATNDRDLKRRIRKISGVPLISVGRGKYTIERLPDVPER